MITLKIGRGIDNTTFWEAGILSTELNQDHSTWTLEQLGRALAKQLGMADGMVELVSLDFTFKREKPKKQEDV